MPSIHFFEEEITFKPDKEEHISRWIDQVISKEGFTLQELNFIFCSDNYLYQINQEYLNHDTLTDIVTFDNSDLENQIEGDVFISIDRVKENAEELKIAFEEELHRVMIHGVLHLMGYGDQTEEEKKKMRKKEEACLSLRQ